MITTLRFLPLLLAAACAFAEPADPTSLRSKVMCGYQGWFRCPGDASGHGWVHWSRDGKRIAPETLTFEMWPEMSEYGADERFAAPGFAHADGATAQLFSSDHPATVRRHFEWMRDYGIDGAWLQHFVLELPGGPAEQRHPSRRRVLDHVRAAATATGRTWALTYDISGMPQERIFEVLTNDWKRLVDAQVIADPRHLHHDGKPAVMIFGFYPTHMSAETGHRLADFFATPGPYEAFLIGSGAWNWRRNEDPEWQRLYRRLGAYLPWNVANHETQKSGETRATTNFWAADKADCNARGALWIPVVYPGFGWDNLKRVTVGTSRLERRGGAFFWEQFHAASQLGVDSVFVAMFDEVDEATAVFKVTSSPPIQARFMGYDGLPPDWYLRLTGEAAKRLRAKEPIPPKIPIQP